MGTYLPGMKPVFMRRERLGRDCIADIEKLCYPKIPSTKVHTVRIRDLEPDPNSSDEKIEEEYISLDTSLATFVSAARSNQAKQNEISEKKLIKLILWKRI